MKKQTILKALLTGGMVLMMAAGAFAQDVEVVNGTDEDGLINSEYYVDADGQKVALENGVAGFEAVNDGSQQYPAKKAWLDIDGNLIVNPEEGYACVTRDKDEAGHVILVSFYGADGELMVGPGGYAVVAREYNEAGNKTREAYFDAEENPVTLNGKAYAGWSMNTMKRANWFRPCIMQQTAVWLSSKIKR